MKSVAVLAALAYLAIVPRIATAGPFTGELGGPTVRPLPPAAREADLDEHLGQALDLQLVFGDQNGVVAPLQQHIGPRPAILVFSYYRCPMLCSEVLRGVVKAARDLPWRVGQAYDLVTVSFDPSDRPADAQRKRASALAALQIADTPETWPFLVGEAEPIRRLTDDAGFRYGKDESSGQYAHAAVILILTPQGKVSRYLYGVDYPARDVRLALLEASQGRIGNIVDRVLMTCYQYDPATHRYAAFIAGFMRVGASFILTAVLLLLGILYAKERTRARGAGAS